MRSARQGTASPRRHRMCYEGDEREAPQREGRAASGRQIHHRADSEESRPHLRNGSVWLRIDGG